MIPQKLRLRRWRVEKIIKKGRTAKIDNFIIKYTENKCNFDRFSVVMSKKFEKLAVTRNRKRRQVYESIRNIIKTLDAQTAHFDIILIPYKKILSCNYEKIYQNVNNIFKQLKKIT